MERKKRVKCPICGKYNFPTKDHVPPKSCNNRDAVIKTYLFPTPDGYERLNLIQQGGLNYSYICSDCNNRILGEDCDPELARLYNQIVSSTDDVINMSLDVTKLIKAVFGHILATGSFSPCVYDKEMRDFIIKNAVPKKAHLYILYYPYRDVFIIRNVIPIAYFERPHSTKVTNAKRMFSCFYFYPLAFIVTDPGFNSPGIDLVKTLEESSNALTINKNMFKNLLTNKVLPPCWPCNIGSKEVDDTVDAILGGREASEALISRKKP